MLKLPLPPVLLTILPVIVLPLTSVAVPLNDSELPDAGSVKLIVRLLPETVPVAVPPLADIAPASEQSAFTVLMPLALTLLPK
jgi:hypothetical protein